MPKQPELVAKEIADNLVQFAEQQPHHMVQHENFLHFEIPEVELMNDAEIMEFQEDMAMQQDQPDNQIFHQNI